MRIRLYRGQGLEVMDDVELVLVENADGTPLAVAAKHTDRLCIVSSIDNPDTFNKTLKTLGLLPVEVEKVVGLDSNAG